MSQKKFLLRISPELWEELNRWAGEELRSVNGQIEYILRQAVRKHRQGRDNMDSSNNSVVTLPSPRDDE